MAAARKEIARGGGNGAFTAANPRISESAISESAG